MLKLNSSLKLVQWCDTAGLAGRRAGRQLGVDAEGGTGVETVLLSQQSGPPAQ